MQHNKKDPVSGFQGIPRNMTGLAEKLRTAGYATAMVGKWHAGVATPDHAPAGRGFDTSLFYFAAANDYWDSTPDASVAHCPGLGALVDLSNGTRAAAGQNNSRACSQANQAPGCVFEDELFRDHIVTTITKHDASKPLFAFIAWHGVHVPLEVPQAYVDRFAFINDTNRALYAAKAAHMDDMTGDVIAALRAAGLYDNSVVVLSSDNGAPLANGNNWPYVGTPRARAAAARPLPPDPAPPRPPSPPQAGCAAASGAIGRVACASTRW